MRQHAADNLTPYYSSRTVRICLCPTGIERGSVRVRYRPGLSYFMALNRLPSIGDGRRI